MKFHARPNRVRRGKLDTQLSPEGQAELITRMDNGMTYAQAIAWLREKHGVEITHGCIWQWISRHRREKAGRTFDRLLETLKADKEQAAALRGEALTIRDLNQANILLLSQALFEARRNDDTPSMMTAARMLGTVMGAVNGAKRADISAFAAETGRRKVDFDAAAAALQHAGELQKLHRDKSLPHREKVARAVLRLFGPRPAWADPDPALAAPASAPAARP